MLRVVCQSHFFFPRLFLHFTRFTRGDERVLPISRMVNTQENLPLQGLASLSQVVVLYYEAAGNQPYNGKDFDLNRDSNP